MNDTDPIIAIICDADLTRSAGFAEILRASYTTLEAVQLYVEHRRRAIENSSAR